MNLVDPYIPKIDSVPAGIHRPLWSVMIPTYNCAKYLRQNLESVLQQDAGSQEMQIEVVDDCSTKDDPRAVVEEIGKGRVSFYRQPQNAGATANFNTCIRRSLGHFVHILHGDDLVLPSFYANLGGGLRQNGGTGAAFCRYVVIEEDGHWQYLSGIERRTAGYLENWLFRIALEQVIQCPSIVVRRTVYETLGGYHSRLIHAADWEMWKRIAVHYPFWYEPQPLACYRIHNASDTSRLLRSGANVADTREAIRISEAYLPSNCAKWLSKRSLKHWATHALGQSRVYLGKRDLRAAFSQIREAVRCSSSPRILLGVVRLLLWAGCRSIIRGGRLLIRNLRKARSVCS
jgi:glycosyltransferase involved in cell wall biosynthesis